MKKLILVIFFMLMLSGCGQRKKLDYFSDNSYDLCVFVQNEESSKIEEKEMSWTEKAELLPEQIQKMVNEISEEVCQFLNNEYAVSWKHQKIEVYSTDVTKSLESMALTYGACYYNNRIYIDKTFLNDIETPHVEYILAHELLHYLARLNGVDDEFSIKVSEEDIYVGKFLEEFFVDSLAKRYIQKKYPETDTDTKSGYCLGRMFIEILLIQIPDLYQYFLNNKVYELKEVFDSHAKKQLKCNGSAFEKFISMLDECLYEETLVSSRASLLFTYLAMNTPKEKAQEFFNTVSEYEVDLDEKEFSTLMVD